MNGGDDFRELATAILRSETFWAQTVPLAAAAIVLLAAGCWLVMARFRRRGPQALRALAGNESGSAEAMDFVLTFPIVMFVTFMFVQLMMGANASLIVHYSAYSAARAARTAFFDLTVNDVLVLRAQSAVADEPLWQANLGSNTQRAQRLADNAARIALMAAVPSSVRKAPNPTGAGAIILNSVGPGDRNRPALRNKAGYAFVPGNVRVDVKVVDRYKAFAFGMGVQGKRIEALPVHARVDFRYPLTMPGIARVFGTNGAYAMSAEVTLL